MMNKRYNVRKCLGNVKSGATSLTGTSGDKSHAPYLASTTGCAVVYLLAFDLKRENCHHAHGEWV